ncbi:MAG: NusG domain II-containing protein [bacterium]|nr:NusG domain II-containing protein [bacterium]
MRRRDILFIAGVVLFVIVCFFLRGVLYHGDAAYVEFSQDGNVIRRVRMSGETVQEIRIDAADGGYNLVHIENGSVFVSEADCENGDCIRQGAVSRPGSSIICLPHRLVITIVGGREETDRFEDADEEGGTDKNNTYKDGAETDSTEQYDTIVR